MLLVNLSRQDREFLIDECLDDFFVTALDTHSKGWRAPRWGSIGKNSLIKLPHLLTWRHFPSCGLQFKLNSSNGKLVSQLVCSSWLMQWRAAYAHRARCLPAAAHFTPTKLGKRVFYIKKPGVVLAASNGTMQSSRNTQQGPRQPSTLCERGYLQVHGRLNIRRNHRPAW